MKTHAMDSAAILFPKFMLTYVVGRGYVQKGGTASISCMPDHFLHLLIQCHSQILSRDLWWNPETTTLKSMATKYELWSIFSTC